VFRHPPSTEFGWTAALGAVRIGLPWIEVPGVRPLVRRVSEGPLLSISLPPSRAPCEHLSSHRRFRAPTSLFACDSALLSTDESLVACRLLLGSACSRARSGAPPPLPSEEEERS